MTTLLIAVICIIVLVILSLILLRSLFGQQSSAQYMIDAATLSSAKQINDGDKVGQMNQLTIRSRELVFTSRQRLDSCREEDFTYLSPLCERLYEDAIEGHRLAVAERRRMREDVVADLLRAVDSYNRGRSGASVSLFPWLKTYEPEIVSVEVGRIKGVESNIVALPAVQELFYHDTMEGNIQDGSRLFKAGRELSLPAPDDGLMFRLDAIPAYVLGTAAPPRLANPEVFEPVASIYQKGRKVTYDKDSIPCSIRVISDMEVTLDQAEEDRKSLSITSVGVTGGAFSLRE